MTKRIIPSLLLGSLLMIHVGCGGGTDSLPGTGNPRSGALLFQTPLSTAELSDLRTHFLETTPVLEDGTGRNRFFNVATQRSHADQPNAVLVHTYNMIGPSVLLAVTLPEAFRWNIPQSIRNQITQQGIDTLDLFFICQNRGMYINDPTDLPSLKPGYWMFPNRPPLDQIPDRSHEYTATALLGLFESDYNIENQVRSNTLNSFSVILHGGRVSPNTAHLNIDSAPAGSFAFYSLAIFPAQRRAAVTLHGLLALNDLEQFRNTLTIFQHEGNRNTFSTLLDRLDGRGGIFENTTLMRKLRELTQP